MIEATSKEKVAQHIYLIQFFPYHTKKYQDIPQRIPTEYLTTRRYNFYLLEKALKREATIIILRGKKQWFEAVPSIKNYKNVYFTNSNANTTLSRGNLKNFDEIAEKINNASLTSAQ